MYVHLYTYVWIEGLKISKQRAFMTSPLRKQLVVYINYYNDILLIFILARKSTGVLKVKSLARRFLLHTHIYMYIYSHMLLPSNYQFNLGDLGESEFSRQPRFAISRGEPASPHRRCRSSAGWESFHRIVRETVADDTTPAGSLFNYGSWKIVSSTVIGSSVRIHALQLKKIEIPKYKKKNWLK